MEAGANSCVLIVVLFFPGAVELAAGDEQTASAGMILLIATREKPCPVSNRGFILLWVVLCAGHFPQT